MTEGRIVGKARTTETTEHGANTAFQNEPGVGESIPLCGRIQASRPQFVNGTRNAVIKTDWR